MTAETEGPGTMRIVESSERNGERREWTEHDPAGVRHRVVIVPRGTSLRDGSGASDFVTAAVELIVAAVVSVAAEDGSWKVGVLRTKSGIERFVHKGKQPDLDSAIAEATRLRNLIREGQLD